MNDPVLKTSFLFSGIPAAEWQTILENTPHHIRSYDRGQTVFHVMEPAAQIGIILAGCVEVKKSCPNGSQVNVATRGPGEMIGAAAAFSRGRKYPCDIVAPEPVTVMMFRRDALLKLMRRDVRVMENLVTEIASAAYMLQQRLELFSYSGIAQKAAFWLLMQARQTKKTAVQIPGSVSKWAMQMNVSRPSLHRELKRLEEQSIISYAPPVIEILDPEALQEILNKA